MKIIKKIFSSVMLLLICNIAFGNTDTRDSIIIEGVFMDSAVANTAKFEVTITEPNAVTWWPSYTEVYQATAVDGKFRLVLPAVADLFYASFRTRIENVGQHMLYYTSLDAAFLFQPGDQINMKVYKDNSIQFSGKGSEKLRCQQKIYQSEAMVKPLFARLVELNNDKNYQEYYKNLLPFVRRSLQLKLDILESYNDLDQNIRDRIAVDCYGLSFYQFYKNFILQINSEKSLFAVKFWKEMLHSIPAHPINSQTAQSYYLSQALYNRSLAEVRIRHDYKKGIPFGELYDYVGLNYEGALRDQIWLICFYQFPDDPMDVQKYAERALNEMEYNKSSIMLKEWINKMKTGNPAFDFQLKDVNGNLVKLDDFKGKVLVLDFWYNGCFGCKYMPSALQYVIQEFKSNKDLVFLSVNVDKLKTRWETGIKSGEYTLKKQIDVSTYPEGFIHPILKHYNYKSFPQLLIIGKNGENVSADPPDPRSDKGEKLIKLLKKSL